MREHTISIYTVDEMKPALETEVGILFEDGTEQPGIWDGKTFRNPHGKLFHGLVPKEWYYKRSLNIPSKQTKPENSQEAERWEAIRQLGKERFESEGDLEIDDDAVVSEGDDNGAYLQCWKWIDFMDTSFDKREEQ